MSSPKYIRFLNSGKVYQSLTPLENFPHKSVVLMNYQTRLHVNDGILHTVSLLSKPSRDPVIKEHTNEEYILFDESTLTIPKLMPGTREILAQEGLNYFKELEAPSIRRSTAEYISDGNLFAAQWSFPPEKTSGPSSLLGDGFIAVLDIFGWCTSLVITEGIHNSTDYGVHLPQLPWKFKVDNPTIGKYLTILGVPIE